MSSLTFSLFFLESFRVFSKLSFFLKPGQNGVLGGGLRSRVREREEEAALPFLFFDLREKKRKRAKENNNEETHSRTSTSTFSLKKKTFSLVSSRRSA